MWYNRRVSSAANTLTRSQSIREIDMSSIPHTSGIYQILCATNGKYYVGSAINLWQRWQWHRKDLRGDRHYNIHLQRAWNKYGEDAFTFFVIEEVETNRLLEREQHWIDHLQACDDRYGFNIMPTAGSPRGIKRSPETRAKLSEIARNRSPEYREKMAAAQRGKSPSAETRAKLAEAIRRRDPALQEQFFAAGPGKGHIKSEETRAKISENNRNRSPELRQRIATRIREAKQNESDEVKAKRHAPHSPEAVEKIRNAARNRSTEYREKMRELKRKENLSPETRERLRQGALAREERKRAKKDK